MAEARELNPQERLDWLRLWRSDSVGPVTFFRLLQQYGSAANALNALPELAKRGGRVDFRVCGRAEAERELGRVAEAGARLVAWGEPLYPALLAEIEDAPPLVSVKGSAALLEKRSLAIVGARNASAAGQRFARELAWDLGRAGFLVTSGFARGIDAAAHGGALQTGTVGVLAGGIDVCYPEENRRLYDEVVERGLLIAEMPVGTQPQARHFPRRNRIISGMSEGVVVVEAALKSGSLITARRAAEQGREVFAVPGSPLDPRCRGTNDLIKTGAALIENAEDVIAGLPARPMVMREDRRHFATRAAAEPGEAVLDAARRKLVEALGPTPVPVDDLIRGTGLAPPIVATILLELELAGRLDRLPGNRVSLAG